MQIMDQLESCNTSRMFDEHWTEPTFLLTIIGAPYLLCFGSASVMSVSTVWMLSRVSNSSASDDKCLLVSEYRNSIRRGAKAWI